MESPLPPAHRSPLEKRRSPQLPSIYADVRLLLMGFIYIPRPVTGNTVQSHFFGGPPHYTDPFAMALDVQSFSYEYEVYPAYHFISPWKAVGGGESASCISDRGYYGKSDPKTGHNSPYANQGPSQSAPGLMACVKGSWYAAATSDYVYGNFAWTGYDYKGETAMGWPV